MWRFDSPSGLKWLPGRSNPDVRFTPESGHQLNAPGCPLCAKSRLMHCKIKAWWGPACSFCCALNHAFASQRIHFVAAVAKNPKEHLVRVFSELWRRGIGIEDGLAKVNGAFNSLHVAGA